MNNNKNPSAGICAILYLPGKRNICISLEPDIFSFTNTPEGFIIYFFLTASSDAPAQTADNSAAAAAGEVWKCTQTLNTPSGYSGGPVRLELIQNVNGTPTASVVLEDQVIQFPYDLDITGAPGISEGTLYLSEQISGTYQELGNYSITFAKAE